MLRFRITLVALTILTSAACADGGDEGAAQAASPTAAAAGPSSEPSSDEAIPGSRTVSSRANIFGAGYAAPPVAAEGGSGDLPPVWPLPPGKKRMVTFPSVTGMVRPVFQYEYNGPAGDRAGPTDITSARGISGIVHKSSGMFLVGVFLADASPATAPPRLDVTREDVPVVRPLLGQTFFVGDGKRRRYDVPDTATRLFLGFADSADYRGPPQFYNNNSGELSVVVSVSPG